MKFGLAPTTFITDIALPKKINFYKAHFINMIHNGYEIFVENILQFVDQALGWFQLSFNNYFSNHIIQ